MIKTNEYQEFAAGGATTPIVAGCISGVKSPLLSGDELGWRLSGVIDGEGCFTITIDPRKGNVRCGFLIGMRADDRSFLELLQQSTGLGTLYTITPGPLALASRPGTNPQVHWRIDRKADVAALVRLLESYPPLSKKGRDFAIWREAVKAWEFWPPHKARMLELRTLLMESRAYTTSPVVLPDLEDPQQVLEFSA